MIEHQYRVVMTEQVRTIERLERRNGELAGRVAQLEELLEVFAPPGYIADLLDGDR